MGYRLHRLSTHILPTAEATAVSPFITGIGELLTHGKLIVQSLLVELILKLTQLFLKVVDLGPVRVSLLKFVIKRKLFVADRFSQFTGFIEKLCLGWVQFSGVSPGKIVVPMGPIISPHRFLPISRPAAGAHTATHHASTVPRAVTNEATAHCSDSHN